MSTGSGLIRPLVVALFVLTASASPAPVGAQPAAESTEAAADRESFPVVVWNREITRLRATIEGNSPEKRAEAATRRLLDVRSGLTDYRLEVRPTSLGDETGAAILVNGMIVLWVLEKDVDVAAGETVATASERAAANIREWLTGREEQLHWSSVVRGLAWTAGATVAAILFFTILWRVVRRMLARIEDATRQPKRALRIGKADVVPYLRTVQAGLVRTLAWGIGAGGAYIWLTFVLRQFPYTRPWGMQLGGFLAGVFRNLGLGFLQSIPNLFIVAVIFMATRLLTRVATAFFHGAKGQWMEADIAHATQRLVVGLLWVFALVVAYPYLPGSGTAAFQGVSVFIGLMVSLGASGIVGQLLGGLVVVYSRAFSHGDYVRIGEYEGTVTEIGALAAKVLTRRKEEITIPHSVVVGSATTNFSRQARGEGAVVSTSVCIGYDAPWRQVEALLLEAARRTKCILREPPAEVLKVSLSDFSVEYRLHFRVARPAERYTALSEIHAHILDTFNEHGVQIMTPHFEGQPERAVVVPKSKWFAPPASEGEAARPGGPAPGSGRTGG